MLPLPAQLLLTSGRKRNCNKQLHQGSSSHPTCSLPAALGPGPVQVSRSTASQDPAAGPERNGQTCCILGRKNTWHSPQLRPRHAVLSASRPSSRVSSCFTGSLCLLHHMMPREPSWSLFSCPHSSVVIEPSGFNPIHAVLTPKLLFLAQT